jgi:fucose permease
MDSSRNAAESDRNRAPSIVLHFGFAVTGVVTTLLGPILPILIARWSLNDEQAGLFFMAQFLGSMAGVGLFGVLVLLHGYKPALTLGFTLIAGGIAALAFGNLFIGLLATATFGCGLGLAVSATNLWVGEAAGSGRAAALSILNVSWCAGAIVCAPLVMLAHTHHQEPALLIGIGVLAATIALTLAGMHVEPQIPNDERANAATPPPTVSKTVAVVLGVIFFLYVGTEGAVSGWAAPLAKRMGTSPSNLWALTPMFFWIGLFTGRALAPAILHRLKERTLMVIGLLLGLAGSVSLVWVTSFAAEVACVMATGLGFAAFYPLLVASTVRNFTKHARRVTSIMFALGNIGGAVLPWIVGLVSTRTKDLHTGLIVPVAGCLIIILLVLSLRRKVFS